MTFYARHKIRPCTRLSAIKSYNIRFPGRRISRNPVKQGRSVSCRCYNILERGFRVSRRIEERFCISPAEDGCGGKPRISEKKTKPLGVFWGSYYTVIRREESLSTVWKWSGREDLNLRHSAPKADALPGCATPRKDGREDARRQSVLREDSYSSTARAMRPVTSFRAALAPTRTAW